MIIKRREVSVFCWEKPPSHYYEKTTLFILPSPPEFTQIQLLYTATTQSLKSKVWSIDLVQIIRPVPPLIPTIMGVRLLKQLYHALRVVIEADMQNAGLLESKRMGKFTYNVIDLSEN